MFRKFVEPVVVAEGAALAVIHKDSGGWHVVSPTGELPEGALYLTFSEDMLPSFMSPAAVAGNGIVWFWGVQGESGVMLYQQMSLEREWAEDTEAIQDFIVWAAKHTWEKVAEEVQERWNSV